MVLSAAISIILFRLDSAARIASLSCVIKIFTSLSWKMSLNLWIENYDWLSSNAQIWIAFRNLNKKTHTSDFLYRRVRYPRSPLHYKRDCFALLIPMSLLKGFISGSSLDSWSWLLIVLGINWFNQACRDFDSGRSAWADRPETKSRFN